MKGEIIPVASSLPNTTQQKKKRSCRSKVKCCKCSGCKENPKRKYTKSSSVKCFICERNFSNKYNLSQHHETSKGKCKPKSYWVTCLHCRSFFSNVADAELTLQQVLVEKISFI
ncbi:uncharacterized protein LOC111709629 isoform X4 [Eurytemora carolleeae]|uniref:uncharacterized protein LOC111709629 isoform X4 n=1 Tax=Eurytemora carolleeae TaxID=1294199 RepID=UPI000C78F84E|nr:uncharacterized protein LOC111709629 isoform X4 [Eurytemora carolleeae]|eukprot:XP_023339153.1 uncharacterized protein LOC111709629 isoform X4 [Eurytemora affinis]